MAQSDDETLQAIIRWGVSRGTRMAEIPSVTRPHPGDKTPWYAEMNRYHWWILFVSALGWLFDTMDQTLFRLSRAPAITELLNVDPTSTAVKDYGGYATAIFLVGWATGGLIFGIVGDKWGRARTMLLTIVLYSIFTGLSAFSTNWIDYSFYRFLTGLGVGGEFAAGVALVSEALPTRARPFALGLLQALSAVGNIAGAILCYVLLPMKQNVTIPAWLSSTGQSWVWEVTGWRLAMIAGILPALLVIAVRRKLEDPDSYKAAKAKALEDGDASELGSIRDLFGDPRWRRNAIVGMLLATAGVIAVWGVGFWTPELVADVCAKHGIDPKSKQQYVAIQGMLQDTGAFFGMIVYTWIATSLGRKAGFTFALVMGYAAAMLVFGTMDHPSDIYWMAPMLGFCMMTIFGGYAIYFPELFPTRLRATGTAFCYNVARYLAAVGPLTLGRLTVVFKDRGYEEPFRYAAMAVLSIYFLGLITLYFAPETKGKPLPED
jgi:MFS family permease